MKKMYKEKGFLLWFLLFVVVLTMNVLTPLSVADETIPDVTFELGEVDVSKVPFYVRPFSQWISAYSSKTTKPNYKKIVELDGQEYLVISAPKKEFSERVVGVSEE